VDDLLDRLEVYYDAVPRADARVEQIGLLTLFVRQGTWPYYARPSLGTKAAIEAEHVHAVRRRQQELGIAETFEWVGDVTPSMTAAARAAGLRVAEHPLMVLQGDLRSGPVPDDVEVTLAGPDQWLAEVSAVQDLSFSTGGTDVVPVGLREMRAAAAAVPPRRVEDHRALLRRGLLRRVVARIDGEVVAAGGHKPVDGVSEIVGVATLPAFRRRGLGAAVTAELARDARAGGADTVFLSAGDDAVARMYGRLGFVRVGTACIAEPG
jgi:ribosomal protein S18 acetylase RimI-like enzyme